MVEIDVVLQEETREHTTLIGRLEDVMEDVREEGNRYLEEGVKILSRSILNLTDTEIKKEKKTVFNALLNDVVNGNKILSRCLDLCIDTKDTENPDSENFTIGINFEGLIKTNSTKQCRHLFEIFKKSKSANIPEKDFPIIRHPVIALFIWKKWRKAIWFFLINAVLYGIFLSNYTFMILFIFEHNTLNGNGSNGTCQSDHYIDDIGKAGIGLYFSVILLILWEIMQMIRLGRLYFKEIENYIELFVFITALLLLADVESTLNEDLRRGSVAVGISLGWIEMVFLTGRIGLITR